VALRAAGGPGPLAAALTRRGHAPEVEGDEARVRLPDAERAAPQLLRDLLGEGLDVFECRVVRPTLEDLFFEVVEDA
jgi:ABC-2 type transport system ATP-binding protein